MAEAGTCARCGQGIPSAGLWGLCTRCLYLDARQIDTAETDHPTLFGNYELKEVLGRGGMGVVYRAVQRSPRRPVALKMILDSELASAAARRRFTLEAELAAKLDHPNIVPIYEVGELEGQPYLSMKLVPGETLKRKIENGELSMSMLLPSGKGEFRERLARGGRLFVSICRAVEHAHQNGVLHRDLKPGNIIVDEEGRPHLTDFGLAKMLEADSGEVGSAGETLPGALLGTPSYMSPEQAQGRRLTAASDLYSLGVLFYEMVTGKPPFQASTPLETLGLVVGQEPRSPRAVNPRLDKDLDTICMKCLEKAANRRYPSAAALADDLERWLRHEPISARPASLGLRCARWVARNRVGTALIVSLCTGLTVTLAILEQALAREEELDLHRANSIHRLSREVDEMWNDPEKRSVVIPSSALADVANLPPRQPDGLATRITFGKTVNHEPLGQAMQYAPFLNMLERRTERILERSTLIDLRFYKTEADALREMIPGRSTIQRMEPVLYYLSSATMPGAVPIAWERSRKEAVIFASKESGITNLSQLHGKRLVLGQANSVITFWAKVHLVRAGLRAADLHSFRYINGRSGVVEASLERASADQDPNLQANKRAVQEVAIGNADVGVAPRRQFELARDRKRGLRELHAFPIPSDLYVACPGFDPHLLHSLLQGLLSFEGPEDRELLGRLSDNVVIEGFEPASDRDFDDIRAALENEIAEFDGASRPIVSPGE